ncbi:MAG: MORN repeat-containing protein [Halioglobus sp.]|nr:MORN repeat-containing protein [Halioglobus sp.]
MLLSVQQMQSEANTDRAMIVNKPTTVSTRIWPNGSKQVGEWKGGLKNGQGIKTCADTVARIALLKCPIATVGLRELA